jgi:hypothetical protein
VKIPVSLFLPFEDLYDLELQGQFLPGHHVTLQPNSTSSTWVDVEELINSQDVDVFDKEGRPCHERVFARLASAREENPHLGNDPYLTCRNKYNAIAKCAYSNTLISYKTYVAQLLKIAIENYTENNVMLL